jgi:retron-type reverse transcriptase
VSSFDNIDHDLLLKAVRHHTDCPWVLLYIERWLKTPMQMEDGSVVPRMSGTPQGAISPGNLTKTAPFPGPFTMRLLVR